MTTVLEFMVERLSADLPIRVRVRADRPVDGGREGDLVSVSLARDGATVWAMVDNMTQGDDGNPSRYHGLEDLVVVT